MRYSGADLRERGGTPCRSWLMTSSLGRDPNRSTRRDGSMPLCELLRALRPDSFGNVFAVRSMLLGYMSRLEHEIHDAVPEKRGDATRFPDLDPH